jgi:hypothetical protein
MTPGSDSFKGGKSDNRRVDIQVPVTYPTTETKAVISVCSAVAVSQMQVNVTVLLPDDNISGTLYATLPRVNTGTAYCSSIVAVGERAKIIFVDAVASNAASVTSPAQPATSGSMARPQGAAVGHSSRQ